MKFQITNRWTGKLQVEIEIDAKFESEPRSIQLGAAVRAALAIGSNLRDSNLRGSDLSGSDLRGSDLSDSDLSGSDLSGSDLRDSDLRGSNLRDSDLRGSDLSGSDLSGSNLRDSNLRDSNLRDSDLSGSDLSGLLPLIAVPSPHRRILAAIEAGGELNMSSWHSCETTHCRAGWLIHFAGKAGAVLEACLGSSAAGALIHLASCAAEPKVPDFHATNEDALADIKRLAELEPFILAGAAAAT